MKKLFRAVLYANRRHRNWAVASALWLLRQVRDIEEYEMHRCEDLLDKFNPPQREREYAAIEDEHSECEYAFSVLEQAIDELTLEYRTLRF
jgi:hypothetical protein